MRFENRLSPSPQGQFILPVESLQEDNRWVRCLADMFDGKLNFINNIPEQTCIQISQAAGNVQEVLEMYALGACVRDALDELTEWCVNANESGNYLMRNLHAAERFCRGFLFEFRTCPDHMETKIKRKHGKDSELCKVKRLGGYLLYGGLNLIYNIAVRIFNHTAISGEEIIGILLLTKQSIISEIWFLPTLLLSEILVMYIWYNMRSLNRTMFCLAIVTAVGISFHRYFFPR